MTGEPISSAFIAVSAASSLASGVSSMKGLQAQSREAEYNARNLELQGRQMSAERRIELNRSLAAIDAIRAGRNVSSTSPTSFAIRQGFRKRSREAEDAEQLGIRVGANIQRNRSREYKRAAPWALIGGIGDAAGKLGSLGGY